NNQVQLHARLRRQRLSACFILPFAVLLASCSWFWSSGEAARQTSAARHQRAIATDSASSSSKTDSTSELQAKQQAVREFAQENQPDYPLEQDDRETLIRIRRALIDEDELSLKARNIQIAIEDDAVRLVGAVDSQEERQKVQQLIAPLA